jgi:hypothetical protein
VGGVARIGRNDRDRSNIKREVALMRPPDELVAEAKGTDDLGG